MYDALLSCSPNFSHPRTVLLRRALSVRPQSYTASAQLLSVSLLDCSSDTLYPEVLSVVPTSPRGGGGDTIPIMSLELCQHRADTGDAKELEGGEKGEGGELTVNLRRLRFIMHHRLLEMVAACSILHLHIAHHTPLTRAYVHMHQILSVNAFLLRSSSPSSALPTPGSGTPLPSCVS
jgi:hypothetical protein